MLHDLLDTAGDIVAVAAVLTSAVAVWSLLPRPRRILAKVRARQ